MHAQFCFAATFRRLYVTQLLFDFVKHAAAHFAPFLAPLLLVLTILCFQVTIFVEFSIGEILWRSMVKKHENPPRNFCSMLLIVHGMDYYLARSKYLFTIKNLVCTHFYAPSPYFGGWLSDCSIFLLTGLRIYTGEYTAQGPT